MRIGFLDLAPTIGAGFEDALPTGVRTGVLAWVFKLFKGLD